MHRASPREGKGAKIVLDEEQAERVAQESLDLLESRGFKSVGLVKSPILGGGNRSKSAKRGNPEWLALIEKNS